MFFKKKESNISFMYIDGNNIGFTKDAYEYVMKLKDELRDVKYENAKLRGELKALKPIIEHKDYKPAMSSCCTDCKYVVRSAWNKDIIGCRIDNVCSKFDPKED